MQIPRRFAEALFVKGTLTIIEQQSQLEEGLDSDGIILLFEVEIGVRVCGGRVPQIYHKPEG